MLTRRVVTLACIRGSFAKVAVISQGKSIHRVVDVVMKESATFEELVGAGFADTWMKVSLEALSHTSFRRFGRQILLEDPGLVWSTLQRRWSEFSAVTPDPSLLMRWLEDVLARQFNACTAVEMFDRYKIIGFVGRVITGFMRRLLVIRGAGFARWPFGRIMRVSGIRRRWGWDGSCLLRCVERPVYERGILL